MSVDFGGDDSLCGLAVMINYIECNFSLFFINDLYYKSLLFLFLIFSSSSIYAKSQIDSIRFTGNDTTQESVLLREMYIAEGDYIDDAKIHQSIQGIRDLELFSEVTYYISETHDDRYADNLFSELVIHVEEKIYLLVIPRLKLRDNQLGVGIQLKWENVFGLDHRLKLLYENKGEEEGVKEYRTRFRYNYKNINDSDYSLNLSLISENSVTQSPEFDYQNSYDDSLQMSLFKWHNELHHKNGEYTSIGFGLHQRAHETLSGQYIDDANANFMTFSWGYKNVHKFAYNRQGKHFGFDLEASDSVFGSESEYIKNVLFYRSYYTFKSRPGDNLNIQAQLGYSTDDILGDKAFKLDFRNDLRGYDKNSYQGNSMLLLNMEYMIPSEPFPTLRYLGFIDVGNTYEKLSDIKENSLNIGIGAGIRWKIKSFVKVDLRFDVGYGLADDNYQFTFGTRHAF